MDEISGEDDVDELQCAGAGRSKVRNSPSRKI
jgi:hypothetical protein